VKVAPRTTFTSWPQQHFVAIGKPKQQMHKASHCGSKQQWRSPNKITLLLLVRTTYIWVLFFAHMPFVVNRTFNATPAERLQQWKRFSMKGSQWTQSGLRNPLCKCQDLILCTDSHLATKACQYSLISGKKYIPIGEVTTEATLMVGKT